MYRDDNYYLRVREIEISGYLVKYRINKHYPQTMSSPEEPGGYEILQIFKDGEEIVFDECAEEGEPDFELVEQLIEDISDFWNDYV